MKPAFWSAAIRGKPRSGNATLVGVFCFCESRDPVPDGVSAQLTPTVRCPTMLVLGIETSCDKTGPALYDAGAGVLHNRVDVHFRYRNGA